jgi:glycosyltransferase involved in cell wall biosynthesis
MSKNNKIFVQIASYRDPELVPTVDDMISKAKNPKNLTFGICWQYDETEDTDVFNHMNNIRVSKHHYSESQGLGWARNKTNQLYQGEKYTLQIDSHHRFVQDWDEIVLEDYKQALKVSKKPIITTYCTPFNPKDCSCKYDPTPCLMSQYEFSSDKLLMSMPWYIQDYKDRTNVIRARTLSGHFFFVDGKFIKEVPYDPDIYFGGYTEETTLSVRAFTNGYDFFSPYRMVMWHEYTRNYRKKHWDDHGTESQTKKTSGERDIFARNKTRQLFGQEDHGLDMGIYGLGSVRTLHDYEVYAGFDFKNCRIQDYTLKVKEPANPTDWESQFISKKYEMAIEWEVDFFKKENFDTPRFMTLGILNKSGAELYRKDFTIDTSPEVVFLQTNNHKASFNSPDKPDKIVMYLFDEHKQWSNRYEKNI